MQSVPPAVHGCAAFVFPAPCPRPGFPRTGDPHSGHRAGDRPARGGRTDVHLTCRAGLSTTDPFPDEPQPLSEAPSIG